MSIYKYLLLISLIFLFSPTITHAATEFISVVDTGGGGDYSTLSAWEQFNQTNLTSAATQVFSGTRTNDIADSGITVYLCRGGVYQSHSGTVVHATTSQILIETITGAATEQANDIWYTNNTCGSANYFTISNGGDSAISVASCEASAEGADQTAVTIEGWDTSDTNYIKIYTTQANRHDGRWDEGKYRLEINGDVLGCAEDYVTLRGLQIYSTNTATGSTGVGTNFSGSSHLTIDKCIIRGPGSVTGSESPTGIRLITTATSVYNIINTIVYDWWKSPGEAAYGIRIHNDVDITCNIYNSVITTTYYGVYSDGSDPTITVKNTVVFNNGTNADWHGTIGTVECCASDETRAGTGNIDWDNESTDWANIFTDYANGDFHLNDFTGTGAIIDQGDDLTAEGFTDDIDGNTRPTSSWDIGADEYLKLIYRSVGPSASSYLERGIDGGGNNLNISGSTATFASDLGTDVGVGDVIQYDDDDNGTIDADDSVAFIHARASATSFTVKNSTGGTPTATLAADQDWSIFRSYDSLSHAESGDENASVNSALRDFDTWSNGKDIVTSNEQWNIACYNGEGDAADQTAVTINDWTTSSANYMRIYTPIDANEVGESQRHEGVWDEGKYRITFTSGDWGIRNQQDYTEIEGIQILARDNNWDGGIRNDNTGVKISHCLIKGQTNSYIGIYNAGSGSNYIWNNIVYDFDEATTQPAQGIHGAGGGPVYVYNNTVVNCNRGLRTVYDDTLAKNNLVYDCADSYYDNFKSGSDYNSTDRDEDMDIVGGGGTNNRKNQTFTFVDENGSPPDYHLASNDAGAKDYGDDLSSDSNLSFSDDIDSDSRPSPYWDIGADEYPAKQKAKFKGEFRFKGEIKIR